MTGIRDYRLDSIAVGLSEALHFDVTEQDVKAFAATYGDVSPVHLDADFAKWRGFDAPLVHGLLVGAYVSNLIGTRLPGRYGVLQNIELAFRAPCYAPNQITVRGTVERVSLAARAIVIGIQATDKDSKVIVTGQARSVLAQHV